MGTGAKPGPTSASDGGVKAGDAAEDAPPDLVPLAATEPPAEGAKRPPPNGLSLLMKRGSKQTADSTAKAAAGSGRRARKPPRSAAVDEGQAKLTSVAAPKGGAKAAPEDGGASVAAAAPGLGGAADGTLTLPESNQDPTPSGTKAPTDALTASPCLLLRMMIMTMMRMVMMTMTMMSIGICSLQLPYDVRVRLLRVTHTHEQFGIYMVG